MVRYLPRDVFFCFFTFWLTIGALASVPSETEPDGRCFFDFPAIPLLLEREWKQSILTVTGREREVSGRDELGV